VKVPRATFHNEFFTSQLEISRLKLPSFCLWRAAIYFSQSQISKLIEKNKDGESFQIIINPTKKRKESKATINSNQRTKTKTKTKTTTPKQIYIYIYILLRHPRKHKNACNCSQPGTPDESGGENTKVRAPRMEFLRNALFVFITGEIYLLCCCCCCCCRCCFAFFFVI
jgi:hypothetical protein